MLKLGKKKLKKYTEVAKLISDGWSFTKIKAYVKGKYGRGIGNSTLMKIRDDSSLTVVPPQDNIQLSFSYEKVLADVLVTLREVMKSNNIDRIVIDSNGHVEIITLQTTSMDLK